MILGSAPFSIKKLGSASVRGDVILAEGSGITITQSGKTFTLASTGGGITIGTTTITGGTTSRVLYDLSGVVQQSATLRHDDATSTTTGSTFASYYFNSRNGSSFLSMDGGGFTGYDSYGLAFGGTGAVNSANKYWFARYGLQYAVANLNASTLTLTLSHKVITVEYTATAAVTITLPSAADAYHSTYLTGNEFIILDTGCGASTKNITVNRAGTDTIITNTTGNTSVVGSTNGCRIMIQCINATTWKANITNL